MEQLIIRNAILEDLPEIAKLHVDNWNKRYREIIAHDYLENIKNNLDKRIKRKMEIKYDKSKINT